MQTMTRMNFLHPPFDNPQIRQAALKAVTQEPILAAMVGNPEYYSGLRRHAGLRHAP